MFISNGFVFSEYGVRPCVDNLSDNAKKILEYKSHGSMIIDGVEYKHVHLCDSCSVSHLYELAGIIGESIFTTRAVLLYELGMDEIEEAKAALIPLPEGRENYESGFDYDDAVDASPVHAFVRSSLKPDGKAYKGYARFKP